MNIKRNPPVALLLLVTALSLCVNADALASSAEECFLNVEVMDINATEKLNKIETVTVKVVLVDTSETPYYCPYEVGEHIQIDEIENGDITVSNINTESDLKLHFWSHSALGVNGPTGATIWRLLELTERKREPHNDSAK